MNAAAKSNARPGPLVSVLTPSYNQARWLVDNLASVACQTYPSIEHVVMDGGSTDGSTEILASAGDGVTWRSEPDSGQADALNKALAHSSGEIIGWLNSDDAFFDCGVVEDVVAFFEAHPEDDVVYGHAARVTADGRVVYIIGVPPISYRMLTWACFLEQPAVFLRRRAVEERFLDDSFHFAMDWELWLRLGRQWRFARIDRVLAVDRVQPGRKMKTLMDAYETDSARLAERYGVHQPWFYPVFQRLMYVASRLVGARQIRRMPGRLAFSGEQDDRRTLLRRQVLSRSSTWPSDFA